MAAHRRCKKEQDTELADFILFYFLVLFFILFLFFSDSGAEKGEEEKQAKMKSWLPL